MKARGAMEGDMGKWLDERIWGIPFLALAAIAFVIAAIFLVWDMSAGAIGPRGFILRWCHGACWLLLGLAALLKAGQVAGSLPSWVAAAGGALYLVFLVVSVAGSSTN
jgi:hypothetical protein